MEEKITQNDIKHLENFIDHIETWIYRHKDTARKLEIGKKITGFIGEALTFRELKRHFRVESAWKGGTHKGYDIYIGGKKKPIEISVKTTIYAYRPKGRVRAAEYQWSLSWGDKEQARNPNLFFVLVDLNNLQKKPDFYIIPSRIIRRHFRYGRRKVWSWPRYHPKPKEIQRYKGKWRQLKH